MYLLAFAILTTQAADEAKAHNVAHIETPAKAEPIAQKVDFAGTHGAPLKNIAAPILQNRPKISESNATKLLQSQMAQLSGLLQGDFSNFSQTFFAPEIGIQGEVPKVFLRTKMLDNSDPTKPSLKVDYRIDDENGANLRARVWRLAPDIGKFGVRARQFELNPLDKNDVKYIEKCDIVFTKRGQGFTGQLENGCLQNIGNGKFAYLSEKYEIDNKTLEVSDLAIAQDGTKIFGNDDNFPSIYKKVSYFSCWASMGDKVQSNIKLHDQGGEEKIDLAGKKFRIRLSAIEWPFGNNRPSLTLYLYTGNDNFAQFYSWAEIDSTRIALAYNEYQVSCTKQ